MCQAHRELALGVWKICPAEVVPGLPKRVPTATMAVGRLDVRMVSKPLNPQSLIPKRPSEHEERMPGLHCTYQSATRNHSSTHLQRCCMSLRRMTFAALLHVS